MDPRKCGTMIDYAEGLKTGWIDKISRSSYCSRNHLVDSYLHQNSANSIFLIDPCYEASHSSHLGKHSCWPFLRGADCFTWYWLHHLLSDLLDLTTRFGSYSAMGLSSCLIYYCFLIMMHARVIYYQIYLNSWSWAYCFSSSFTIDYSHCWRVYFDPCSPHNHHPHYSLRSLSLHSSGSCFVQVL